MLFLDFLRKKEKTGEKTGEISANSCSFFAFSLSSLGFLAYFLGVFCLFSLIFERSRCCRMYFCAFFSFFGGIIAFFICSFSSSAFDFLQSNKKRQFLSGIMMKNKIYGKLFLFFHFLFFARAIFT